MRRAAQSLLMVAGLLGTCSTAQAQPQSVTLEARAQEHYQVGRDQYRAGAFEQAREAFAASLLMVDSPNTRMYLGRTLRQLGRLAEAYAVFDRAALDAGERARTEPRYAATRDSARAEADSLLPLVARLRVQVAGERAGAAVSVNGVDLAPGVWGETVPMEPGAVRVVLSGAGVREETREVELTAGQLEELNLTIERVAPLPEADAGAEHADAAGDVRRAVVSDASVETESGGGAWRTAGVVTMLTGGATLGGALAFGLLTLNGYNLLNGLYQSGRGDPNNPLIAQGETYRDASNVMFAVGGTMFATGLTFWLLGRFAWRDRPAPRVVLTIDPRAGVGAAGTF